MRFSAGSTAVFIRWSLTSVMNGCAIRIPEGVRIRIRLFGHYEIAAGAKAAPEPGDLVYRQRRHSSRGSLHAQAGDGGPRAANAENGLPPEESGERRAKWLGCSGRKQAA